VRGRAPPKPGCKVALLDSRVQSGRASKGARTQLAERLRNRLRWCSRATTALRGRIDFEWLFQACTHSCGTTRRVGTRGAELQSAEQASPRRKRSRSLRVRWSRAGRLATTECIGSTRTEAGDGENPRPLSVFLPRERRAHEPKRRVPGRSRDAEPTRRCTSAPLRPAGETPEDRDRAVTVHGRTSSEVRESIREWALDARRVRINLEGAARLNVGCAARLNREARSLDGFVLEARLAEKRSRRLTGSGGLET